jgi:predicted MFS family arabinose efflux permease
MAQNPEEPAINAAETPILMTLVPPPLRHAAFRFQFVADLMTSCAFEMETLILGWFILVQTESVLLLAVFGALQSLGTLCAPFFGLGAERIGTRNLLAAMRCVYVFFATTLMVLALGGLLSPVTVFVTGTLMGLVRSSDIAMRNLLVNDLMPAEHLMTALSISRMTADIARTCGALTGAGIFAALGIGPAYIAVSAFYAIGLGCTLRISSQSGSRVSGPRAAIFRSPFGDLRDGFAYARGTPLLLAALLLAFLVNFTAYPLSGGLLAYIARDLYLLDQNGLGTLSAAFALGGLAGSFVLSLVGAGRNPARLMVIASIVWHLVLVGFVLAPALSIGIAALALAGFVQNFCMIPMSLVILRTASDRFRGRVMGLRMLAIYGLPLGLTLAGMLTAHFGLPLTGALYCAAGVAMTVAIAVRWRQAIWP